MPFQLPSPDFPTERPPRFLTPVEIRRALRPDLPGAARLVQRVVRECVGAWFEKPAIDEYCAFSEPIAVLTRFEAGHRFWIASTPGEIHGVLEVKGAAHVLMLFVAPECQRSGIGRSLLHHAFPGFPDYPHSITVNSVPQSVAAYERMGFVSDGPEQNVRGIRFVPMKLEPRSAP